MAEFVSLKAPAHANGRTATTAPQAAHVARGGRPASLLRPAQPMGIPASPLPVQRKIEIGSSDHPLEHQADRAAHAAADLHANEPPTRSRSLAGPQLTQAPPLVHRVLSSPGQSLDSYTRAWAESAFQSGFGDVRLHTGPEAEESAAEVHAHAYTFGSHIVLGPGRNAGERPLIAHELAHVLQQREGAPPLLLRESWSERASKWYDQKKWGVYRAMIATAKAGNARTMNFLRSRVPSLPRSFQGPVGTMLDVVSFVLDMLMALDLAIIGLAVGFVEGIVGLVTGIIKLAYGLVKMTLDWLLSLVGMDEAYKQDIDDLINAVKNIPPGIKSMVETWLDKYKKATPEEQVLMGGELVGQIEAFIATFAFAGTKAGQGASLTLRTASETTQVLRTGELAVAPAKTVTLTIPGTVTRFGGEAPVVAAQAMAMSSHDSGSGGKKPKSPENPLKGASDKEIDKAVKDIKAEGEPTELQRHGQASTARKQKGLTGSAQSAHVAPRSAMRGVPGYSADDAFTKLLPRDVHRSMDAFWKSRFQAMQAAGQSNATAQEVFDVVAESIKRATGISPGLKTTLIERLKDELFIELKLKPADMVELPYKR